MNRLTRSCCLLTLIVLLSSSLHAQIHLSGSLSGVLVDTTYWVDSTIYVMPDSSLTIAPGAIFLFDSTYSFIIQGTLYAVGTPTDSIIFRPAPGNDSLGSITFQNMATDSCMLSYCYITGASASAVNVYQTDLTISHCTFTNNRANWGGGVYVSFAAPTISNCVVTNNSAQRNGGGIYCTNSSPIITDCVITGNECNLLYGTGASGRGGGGITANHNSSPTISNCLIANNHSLENGGGIAINDNSHLAITGCTFEYNLADSAGGGIFCSVNCQPVVENCLIYGNRALDGGGIYTIENVSMMVSQCEITADSASQNGGGLFTLRSLPNLSNTQIQKNFAGNDGGGIYCSDSSLICHECVISANVLASDLGARGGGIACFNNAQPFIQNCEISFNWIVGQEGVTDGGGIYCDNSLLTLDRCTLTGNRIIGTSPGGCGGISSVNCVPSVMNTFIGINDPGNVSGQAQITYSDVGGTGIYPGMGNINADPLFVSMFYSIHNFSLQWTSPCIDVGSPDSLDPDGTRADMGAYYYDQSLPVRILLTPHDLPIVLPTNGGSFNYTITVTNRDNQPHPTTAWCNITKPNGDIVGPVLGPVTITLAAGTTLTRVRTQNIPAAVPWGIYHYNIHAVVARDTSSDAFTFVKLGAGGWGVGAGDWLNTGEDFEIAVVGAQRAAPLQPEIFSVSIYPNPFNPTTVLNFELRVASYVRLEVFDVNGRLVSGSRATPTMYEAGTHQITFDGSSLPSGIYFYRLEAGEQTAVGKMVLMK